MHNEQRLQLEHGKTTVMTFNAQLLLPCGCEHWKCRPKCKLLASFYQAVSRSTTLPQQTQQQRNHSVNDKILLVLKTQFPVEISTPCTLWKVPTPTKAVEKKRRRTPSFTLIAYTSASVNWATGTTALVKELILENRARLCLCCWQHTPVLVLVNAEISP